MMKFAVLIALVAVATAQPLSRSNVPSHTDRIVGGVDTSIEQVPHQVSLEVLGMHICGGSIIAARWILTAAQCLIYFPNWYTIRSGSTAFNSGGTVTAVSTVITHDHYSIDESWTVPVNDIALIFMRASLIFGLTQAPIGLYPAGQEAAVGTPAIVTGWGAVTEAGNYASTLQTLTVPIVSKVSCSIAYSDFGGIFAGQICAAVPEGGFDRCRGDAGGPLVIDGLLAGVVSWGNGCARPGYPGVYSEIASYRVWIEEICGI